MNALLKFTPQQRSLGVITGVDDRPELTHLRH